ncbi:MAG: hypothetical protein LC687_01365 [Actinobacteria bacterium]|nr:hypothetical protein [Actinomycetota bacterium]
MKLSDFIGKKLTDIGTDEETDTLFLEFTGGHEVGTEASFGCWTDTYPGIVTKVTPKTVTVQGVDHGPNQSVWPDQDFPILFDKPVGAPKVFRKTKRGYKSNGWRVGFGSARYYQDPSF